MDSKKRYRLVIQLIISLVRACSGLIWASAGPLLPLIMQAYGINRGTAGWFASSAPLTIAVLAVPIGILGAKSSPKKVFAVGAFLQVVGVLAPFCGSYMPLLLTRVFFAIGTAISFTLATTIAAEWFSSRELPLINGITNVFVNAGNALAFTVTVPLATALFWQAPMVIYGAVALSCAVAWVIWGKDHPAPGDSRDTAGTPPPKTPVQMSMVRVLTHRSTILLSLAAMGCWCLGNSIGSWLPTYYHEVFQMPLEKASALTALITGGGTAASIAGGILPLRVGRRKPFLIISGIFMGLSAMCAVLVNNPAVIIISITFFGIFGNLHSPSLFTIPLELPDMPLRSGAIVLFAMLVGGNFGNFVGPLLVGYLADMTGSYLPGFIISAVISLGLLVAGVMLPETGPGVRKLIIKQTKVMQ